MALRDFTQEQKDAIRAQAKLFWYKTTETQRQFFSRIADYERLRRCQLPKDIEDAYRDHPSRSALCPPDILNNVESVKDDLIRYVFSQEKPWFPLGIGASSERSVLVEIGEQKLQELNELSEFDEESDPIIDQALWAGRACCFTSWHRETIRWPSRDETGVMMTAGGRPVLVEQVVAEYPKTIGIDIRQVRWDNASGDPRKAKLVGYHCIKSLVDLQRLRAQGLVEFDPTELDRTTFPKQDYYEFLGSETQSLPGHGEVEKEYGDRYFELMQLYGLFRLPVGDNTVIEDLIVYIVNREYLIAVKRNDLPLPSYQWFDWPCVRQEYNRSYPMGLVEPVVDQLLEKFLKRNQALDMTNRDTYDTYIADAAATEELPEVIEHEPEKIIKLNLMAAGLPSVQHALQPLPRPQRSYSPFQDSLSITTEIQQTMKRNDYVQSVDPSRKETATAVESLVGSAQVSIEALAKNLLHSYFAPVQKKRLVLWEFFKGHEVSQVTLASGETVELTPGMLQAFWRVTLDISTAMERATMVRRFVESYPVLRGDEYWDQYQLRLAFGKAMKFPRLGQLLPPPEYQHLIPQRENIALRQGIEQPVHPMDAHPVHISEHQMLVQWMQQAGEDAAVAMKHLQQHQVIYEQQMMAALGNTKELGGGLGNLGGAGRAAITQR